ncbi:msrB [Symbiodinium natans]|uniref:Peptide-methionine (R)-S-oxide reductase n=1 Tax=Symbiodinium natans TaxID=878477 RepID=A0A812RIF3_9DINO|nr:msrB [Symbiodinium natans]
MNPNSVSVMDCGPRAAIAASAICLLVSIIGMSVSAGGWDILGSKGTFMDAQQCNHSRPIPDGRDLFQAVCAAGGTEAPFTGVHNRKVEKDASGVYRCACCGEPLFTPKEKYNSGTGWPSFDAPVEDALGYRKDILQFGSTEVHCKQCGAHLGHVFDDGPATTGLRYCINSVCLWFDETSSAVATASLPFVLNSYLVLLLLIGCCGSCCVLSKHAAIAGQPVYKKWRQSKTAAGTATVSAWPSDQAF